MKATTKNAEINFRSKILKLAETAPYLQLIAEPTLENYGNIKKEDIQAGAYQFKVLLDNGSEGHLYFRDDHILARLPSKADTPALGKILIDLGAGYTYEWFGYMAD